MAQVYTDRHAILDWAVIADPKQGETETGDRHLVVPEEGGVLAAVIDGLGHGAPAGVPSQRAVDVLMQYHEGESVSQLIRRCHDALVGTRGVVMGLARFTPATHALTWLGVGNVEGRLVRRDGSPVSFLVRSGIVGANLPVLRATVTRVDPGDVLVITTDGIDPAHGKAIDVHVDPPLLASEILASYGNGMDDALVLVARYRKWQPVSDP